MQARLHITPVQGKRIHDQREQLFAARGVGRRQRVATPTVTGNADRGHGLGWPSIQADGGKAFAGRRVEGVELGETGVCGPVWPRTEFDRIGTEMPLRHLVDRGLQIERRVTAIGTHQIVFHHERHGAIRVLVRCHAPAVTQVALVTHGDVMFCMAARGDPDVVGHFPFGQGISGVGRVDRFVIRLGVFRRTDLEQAVGTYLRVGEKQETVQPGGCRRASRPHRNDVARGAGTASTTAARRQQQHQHDPAGTDQNSSESHHRILQMVGVRARFRPAGFSFE